MKSVSTALALLASLFDPLKHQGVTNYRTATPNRQMRRGEDGQRKAGRYGRGLRNWITMRQREAMAEKAAKAASRGAK